MRFTKGHGTGNDFVIVPDPDGERDLSAAEVRAICERHSGVGADGLLRVVQTAATPDFARVADDARWFMDYRNADGSVVETCGNGIRVFARYLLDAGHETGEHLRIATRDGVKEVVVRGDEFTVDMGTPKVEPADPVHVRVDRRDYDVSCVTVGNPHAVLVVDAPGTAPVHRVGAALQRDPQFPSGVNVEFVSVHGRDALSMRVWERGVGETQSCGSGACAAVVATTVRGLTDGTVSVTLPGGELKVAWTPDDGVLLTGPALLVAEGVIDDRWLAASARNHEPRS